MASVTSTVTPTPRTSRSAADAAPARPTSSGRAGIAWHRWALRAGYAIPLGILNVVVATRGFVGPANRELLDRSRAIHWGASDLSFVTHVYPPIPAALASLFPSVVALALLGAIAGGAVLEAVHRRLRGSGVGLVPCLLLVGLFAATPWFSATTAGDLAATLAVMFLAMTVEGFARFVLRGETEGGFRAGLALGLAALCHPAAIIAAVAFVIAAPIVARRRYRGRRGAVRATAAVLLFPTYAGLLGWTFLCWRFGNAPLSWLHDAAPRLFVLEGPAQLFERVRAGVLVPLALTPLLAVSVVAAGLRHPLGAIGRMLPVVAMAVATALGVGLPAGATAILLGVVALGSLIAPVGRSTLAALLAVGLLGVILRWTITDSSTLALWEHALTR